jgi:hypothetical protein
LKYAENKGLITGHRLKEMSKCVVNSNVYGEQLVPSSTATTAKTLAWLDMNNFLTANQKLP